VAAAARALVALVALRSVPIVSDALSYSNAALDIKAHFPGPAYFWPPGMPYALAAVYRVFGTSATSARLLTVTVGVACTALVAVLSGLVLRRPRDARIAAFAFALYPPSLLLASQPYSEELELLCLLALAVCLLLGLERRRPVWFVGAGLAAGYAALTRPSSLTVPIALAVAGAVWVRRRRATGHPPDGRRLFASGTVAAVVAMAVVLPVALHNRSAGGGFTVSTNNERNLFLGNNRYTPLYKTSQFGQRTLDELPPDVRAYLQGFQNRPDARSAMLHEALSYMAGHPVQTLVRTVNRVQAFWGFDYVLSREVQKAKGWGDSKVLPLLALEAGGYLLVAVFAILGLALAWDRVTPAAAVLVLLMVLAFQIPYAIAFAVGFYHAAVIGFLFPFAAAGAGALLDRRPPLRTALRRARVLVPLGVFVVVQAIYAYFAARFK
jgi:4-amino-4-deoxy-L-arabinose transferase-like glycosyltransferase